MSSRKEYEMLFQLQAKLGSNFSGTFKNAESALLSMQSEINALSKTQSDISAYQKQQAALESTRSKLANLQEQYNNLQQEMEETGDTSAAMKNKLLQKQLQIDKTAQSVAAESEKLDQMGNALDAAGVDVEELTSESKRLEAEMGQLQQAQEEAAVSAEEYGAKGVSSMEAVASAIAAAGVAEALKSIYSAYMECVTAAGDYEAAMSNVEALTGATAGELEQLSEMAKEMGATTAFTAEESANAFSYMALAGWDAEEMLEGIEPILSLAAAASMDLAEASDIVTDYLTAFGLTAEDTAGFVDIMAYAMANSNTNVSQLGEAYKACAATASAMGYSVEETTAVLMTMANAGVKGSEAGTALNAIFTRLATNTKDCADALEEYGVYVYDDMGNMNSLTSILEGMAGVWSTLSDEQQANLAKAIAGTSQYSKLQTIMAGCSETAAEGGQSFSDYAEALENCSGSADAMAATMLDNLNGQLTLMQSAFDGLKISIGEEFAPEMEALYQVATDVFGSLQKLVEQNPALVKAVAAFVAVVATATAGITAYAAAAKVVEALDMAALFSGPLGAITAVAGGVAALAAVCAELNAEYEEIVPSVATLTEAARENQEAILASAESYDETILQTDAAAEAAENYIARLQELEAAGLDTDTAQLEYHNTLALLCETVPELADYIDLQTDTIEGGTDALLANTAAWKENAEVQAMQQALSEYMSELATAQTNEVKSRLELEQATAALDEAEQTRTAHLDRMVELTDSVQEATAEYNQENGYSISELDYLRLFMPELAAEYDELANGVQADSDAVYNATMNVQNATEAHEEYAAVVDEAQNKLNYMTEALEDYNTASAESSGLTEEDSAALASYEAIVSETMAQIDELTAAYTEAYEAAYSSVHGQFDLWDEASAATSTNIDTIISNLDSQNAYWSAYNTNLESLQARTGDIEGLSDVIASFADGSSESVAAIAGMASASDEDLQTMVENWKAVQAEEETTAGLIADLEKDFSASMDQIISDFESSVEELNMSSEAASAASTTINAYIDQANSMLSQVTAAYTRIGNAATAALRTSLPSTSGLTGYATGTTSAQRGFALVGEEGPELVYFNGGEQVVTAAETAALQNQLAVQAMNANAVSTEAAVALQDEGGGGSYFSVPVNVSVTVEGDATESTVTKLRDTLLDELEERIADVIEERETDARRRAYN